MFSFRKRKREEEDEPLVPHGLIWHAMGIPEEDPRTDTPQDLVSPEKPQSIASQPEPKAEQPRPLELPVSAQPDSLAPYATSLRREPVAAVNRIGSISPPKAWPSPRVQELTRRAQLDDSSLVGANAPFPIDQVPPSDEALREPDELQPASREVAAHESIPPSPLPKLQAPAAPPVTVQEVPRPGKPFFAETFALIRNELRDARTIVGHELEDLRAKAGQTFRALQVTQKMARGGAIVSRTAADAGTRFVSLSDQAKARSGAWRVAASAVTKENVDRSTVAISQRLARARQVVSQTWNHPIRIRIRGLGIGKTRSALAGLNQRFRSNFASRHDSRLWTSMAMATLSALLALAVVTGLRGYDPTAKAAAPKQPVNSLSVEQTVTPALPVASRSKSHVAKASPSVHPKAAQAAPLTRTASMKKDVVAPEPPVRKRRLSEEDDYVAKDTYVVYGRDGKPIRR